MSDVYTIVTDRIINLLEQGTIPWHQPWNPEVGQPRNGATGHEYRGINIFMLSHTGYTSPFWYSFKQIKGRGGYVRKGEKSSLATFWKILKGRDEDTSKERTVPLLRYYRVFNQEQAEGIPIQALPNISDDQPHDRIAACEALVAGYPNPPQIRDHNQSAFYRPAEDTVYMPRLQRFETPSDYYSTIFHELTHSTGNKKRLDRPTLNEALRFGSTNYSKEELVAEMGAAYLCGYAGINNITVDQSASYIKSWLARLKDDKRLIVHAAAQAKKAVDPYTRRDRRATPCVIPPSMTKTACNAATCMYVASSVMTHCHAVDTGIDGDHVCDACVHYEVVDELPASWTILGKNHCEGGNDMSTFLWYPLSDMTDADKLHKAAQVMRGAADLMALDNADNVVEIPKSTAGVMVAVLNSMAELVLDIANALLNRRHKEQAGYRAYGDIIITERRLP